MGIISKIKNILSKTKTEGSASVTFYPDKILIVTENIATTGIKLASTKFTKLPIDSLGEVLGEILRKHFSLTSFNVPHPKDFKKHWNEYKAAAGFTTDKSTYKDAKHISCSLTKKEIILYPTENLYNTGYNHIAKSSINIPIMSSNKELGEKLLIAKEISTG